MATTGDILDGCTVFDGCFAYWLQVCYAVDWLTILYSLDSLGFLCRLSSFNSTDLLDSKDGGVVSCLDAVPSLASTLWCLARCSCVIVQGDFRGSFEKQRV